MGVRGLAEGFLAGFNTMDQHERGKKADERMEKDMSLRDAMWQNTQKQQELANTRYEDERAYSRGRDAVNDERQKKLDGLNEMSLRASIAHSQASNARAARSEARQVEMYEWEKDRLQQQKFLEENMPVIQQGWADIQAGKAPGERFFSTVNNKYAAMYNPERYMSGEYADAGKTFVTHTAGLMRDAEAGKLDWNSDEGVQRINQPEFLKAAGVLYQDEVKTGIGDVDPKTGKTIKNKELANVHVTPDGAGVVLGVKVTYDDGSSTVRPVTEGRSAREDDQPKVIPLMDFVGSGYKRSALAKEFSQNAEQLRVSLGLTPGADVKGYRKAVADLRADTQARLYKIETDPNITDASERERLMEAERMREKTGISELGGVYGVSQPKSAAESDNGGESPLSSWVSGDQQKIQFIQESSAHGKPIPNDFGAAQLDKLYQDWVVKQQASNTASSIRGNGNQTASSAQPQGQRAAEQAVLGLITDPYKNAPTLKNAAAVMTPNNETLASAYKAMSNR